MADELTEVSQPPSSPVPDSRSDVDLMLQQPRGDGSDESNTSAEMEPSIQEIGINTNTILQEPEPQVDALETMDTTPINVEPVVQVVAVPMPAIQAAPPPPNPTVLASIPKARLPQDTTGLLEDRIKEDPRGDMDAWLALISEHRKRNKIDDARAVYERFFSCFNTVYCNGCHVAF